MNAGKVVLLILATFVVLIGSCVALVRYGAPKIGPQPGQNRQIDGPNSFGAYGANSAALMRETERYMQARQTAVVEPWIRDGHVWFLSTNTRVHVLQTDNDLTQVTVMSGQHAGKTGWVRSNVVK